MKRISTLLLLIFSICLASAQEDITLPGVVVEQNSEFNTGTRKYLSNVQVKSSGAQPQLTDSRGKFTLIFADKPKGNSTQVSALKNGYELVNTAELKNTAVLGRKSPVQIVMCEKGRLYANQMTYYNIAKDAALERYQKRVAILNKEGREKDALIAELQEKFNQQISTVAQANELLEIQLQRSEEQARNLASQWVTINLDDQSESYREAFKAFLNKDIEGALKILDNIDFEARLSLNFEALQKEEKNIDVQQETIARQREELEQDIEQCLFKAGLYELRYEFKKAEAQFELALKYDPKNVNALLEFTYFLRGQNKYNKAIQKCHEAIAVYDNWLEEDPENRALLRAKANVQSYFGGILLDVNDLENTEKHLNQAVSILQKLEELEPNLYLNDISSLSSRLGTLYRLKNLPDLAIRHFNEALDINKKLFKEDSTYLSNIAGILTNIGNLYLSLVEIDSAKRYLNEAIGQYRILSTVSGDHFDKANLANALTSLAGAYSQNKEYDMAEQAASESVSLFREVVKVNPASYSKFFTRSLVNYSTMLKNNQKYEQALATLEEALSIQRKLAVENPEAYNLDIGLALIAKGQLFQILLENENNPDLRNSGLEAINEARSRLSIYPDNNSTVQYYQREAGRLSLLFAGNNENAVLLNNTLDTISYLKQLDEEDAKITLKIQIQDEVISRYARIIKDLSSDSAYIDKLIEEIALLSWYLMIDRQFEEAEQQARFALGLNMKKPNHRCLSLVAVAMVYQGKLEDAKVIYHNLKDLVYGSTNFREVFLEDLDYLESKEITHPDVAIVRKMLKKS